MGDRLKFAPLVLPLFLLLLPAAAGAFSLSLPADSAVKIESPSRLGFTVTNTDEREGLSRLTLRFPSGYRVMGGSPPPGWIVEPGPGTPDGAAAEVGFRTSDEAKCTGAIAPGSSLVFGVELIAASSRAVTPDRLEGAQGEQSCRGVALDPPSLLPTWNRLGMEAALAAGPPILGLAADVTVTMTVTNLSTVELTDVSALLSPAGTGSLSGLTGPTPGTLTLAPAASGSMTWTARAASAGTVSFGGQAVGGSVTSLPAQSETLFVGDLDISLGVTPEQVVSGEDVQVQMTVTNRGPIRLANVIPSSLNFVGVAVPSPPAGPSPAGQAVLEPGASTTFTWAATMTGRAGDTYAYSGWVSAEWGSIVSQNAASNSGALGQADIASDSEGTDGGLPIGGGGAAGDTAGVAAAASASGSAAAAVPSASLQFIAVNNDGTSAGGAAFSGDLVRALRILVGWQNLSGTHSERLEIFSPDGSLYQQFAAQFAGTPVETRLPVSGTWITQSSLFGAWRVDVYLDGGGMPITSGVFVLTP